MNREVAGRRRNNRQRRRFGWGAAAGIVLAMAGATLLLMVFMIVTMGTSWLPVSGVESLPLLISRTAPALAPAPTEKIVILPTPLPGDRFASAAAPQSDFGSLSELDSTALLPESPAVPGLTDDRPPAGDNPAQTDNKTPRLEIAAIGVEAPIKTVGQVQLEEDGRPYYQWQVPSAYAVGWHVTSAAPGSAGNTVMNGHNNVHGAVFRDLVELELGDEITLYENGQTHHYLVAHREVLEEKDQPLDVRLDNAKWMLPTSDERLTLITCWPNTGATHRVIVVATPVDGG
jgi:LPXTG-site transpeptidase (sortase) family protein